LEVCFHQIKVCFQLIEICFHEFFFFFFFFFFYKKWKFGLKFWNIFPTTWNMFHQNNGLFHQMEVWFIKLESMDFTFWMFFSSNSSLFSLNCVLLHKMKAIAWNWNLCPLTSVQFHQIDIHFHILEQCYYKLFHRLCFQLLVFSFTYFRFAFSYNWIFVVLNWRLFHQIESCFIYLKFVCTCLRFASPNIGFFPLETLFLVINLWHCEYVGIEFFSSILWCSWSSDHP
jgi:hypothetical protein